MHADAALSALRRALRCAHGYSEYSHRRWLRLHAGDARQPCAARSVAHMGYSEYSHRATSVRR